MKKGILGIAMLVLSSSVFAYPGQRCVEKDDCYSVITGVAEVCEKMYVRYVLYEMIGDVVVLVILKLLKRDSHAAQDCLLIKTACVQT